MRTCRIAKRGLIGCCLLSTILVSLVTVSRGWAAPAGTSDTTVSVADLEHLTQQIQDAQQRERLLKTLQALIAVAKQEHRPPASQAATSRSTTPLPSPFLVFGLFTQHLAMAGRVLGQSLAALPVILAELPARLAEPTTFWLMLRMGIVIGILAALGIALELIAARLLAKHRLRRVGTVPLTLWHKAWSALLTMGFAVMPYGILLIVSSVILSVFPVGVVLSGLVALAIVTGLLYRLAQAIALSLLHPDDAAARLLPLRDPIARMAWTWSSRLIVLWVAYYGLTRALLTIRVPDAVYRLARGSMIAAVAIVLSLLVMRLTQAQRARLRASAVGAHQRFWSSAIATLRRLWPIIAIVYIWCTAIFALADFRQGVTYMLTASLQTAAVVGLIMVMLWLVSLAFTKALTINDRLGQYLAGLELRTLRYLQMAWWGVRLLLVLIGILGILQVWGLGMAWFFTSPEGSDILSRLVVLVVTLALVALVVDLSTFASQKLTAPDRHGREASKQRKTLIPLGGAVIKYAALFTGALVVLHEVGVNVTPILAGVGILGLAVGFGAQTLVKDIINGLFILFEDSISVGDVVVIKGTGGLVEAVNLRTIRLRDLDGSVHIIPNSQAESITNMTKDFSYYVLDVSVAYREDTDEVIAALREIDTGMRQDPAFAPDMLEPIEILGVDRFADSAVVIKARLKTEPIKQWSVGREYNRRMKQLFDARGIEIPFPHRTIYWGEPKQGEAPPMRLHIGDFAALAEALGQADHHPLPSDAVDSQARKTGE